MQTAPLSYGSDQSGLVCGYVFGREADGTGRPLDTEEARERHAQRAASYGRCEIGIGGNQGVSGRHGLFFL